MAASRALALDSPTDEYIRLHITPFNPSLLPAILPPSLSPHARNISFHSLQTFPEKAYGYLELPASDAEKMKKKLNGAILKGTKVRVETARPAKDDSAREEDAKVLRPKKEKQSSKKRKRGGETIAAVELNDRKVKRGWTTPSADLVKAKRESKEKQKMVIKSKYTTEPECLFKTVLPPNIAVNVQLKTKVFDIAAGEKVHKVEKKDAVVHEFTRSTKFATFLRGPGTSTRLKSTAGFVEGTGWVDEDGNLIESVVKKARAHAPREVSSNEANIKSKESTPVTDASAQSSSGEESDADIDSVGNLAPATNKVDSLMPDADEDGGCSAKRRTGNNVSLAEENIVITDKVQASRSAVVDEEAVGSTSIESGPDLEATPKTAEKKESAPSKFEIHVAEDTISSESISESESKEIQSRLAATPPSSTTPPPENSAVVSPRASGPQSSSSLSISIHPLEALYKRSKPEANAATPKTTETTFSFFGADSDEIEGDLAEHKLPQTPFTQRDREHRGMRSAAPTPDTAHPTRQSMWPYEEEAELPSSPVKGSNSGKQTAEAAAAASESDFGKWFYEHRGDNTRAWKKRRKTVAKENRQRENRKRAG